MIELTFEQWATIASLAITLAVALAGIGGTLGATLLTQRAADNRAVQEASRADAGLRAERERGLAMAFLAPKIDALRAYAIALNRLQQEAGAAAAARGSGQSVYELVSKSWAAYTDAETLALHYFSFEATDTLQGLRTAYAMILTGLREGDSSLNDAFLRLAAHTTNLRAWVASELNPQVLQDIAAASGNEDGRP